MVTVEGKPPVARLVEPPLDWEAEPPLCPLLLVPLPPLALLLMRSAVWEEQLVEMKASEIRTDEYFMGSLLFENSSEWTASGIRRAKRRRRHSERI